MTPAAAGAVLLVATVFAVGGAAAAASLGPGRMRRAGVAAAAGAVLAGAGVAAFATGPLAAARAILPLAALVLLTAAAARAALGLRVPRGVAAGGATVAATALLAFPFLADAWVEPRVPGRSSPAAIALLLGACPAAGAVGGGLRVDLLRAPRAYGGAAGGLSRIGTFHRYRYPDPVRQGALLAGAAAGLAGVSSLAGRRRRS